MDDLISRQAAIKYLMTNMNWYDEDGYESDDDYKRECITELINGVPSAQPEIIRCKDCRWWDRRADGSPMGYCHACKHGHYSRHWEISIIRTYEENFFCADAERRTDE